jgi:hypothetical protein
MVKMKKIVRADVFFEIETEKNVSIYEKAWEYLDKILPDVFSVEGSELTIYNLDGTEYFESENEEDE